MEGQQVGHYQIIEKIGEGGMGVVYRAEDNRLKRSVALKFLPPDLTRSAEARERFIHEAQAASALDHPNICTIYEIDETDERQIYIVMGLYEGQTLREKISERPLKLEDAIEITSQIARGLARAHEHGIIHRDIKPANIFITAKGEVRILDFGLAKLHGQTKLTLTGTTLGTVSYMAPEQATGAEADHRADIWSLGVMMYEMLTGQQPFRGDHEQAVIYSILNEEPEPITALRTGIPLDLEWVVQKALRKNPQQRYQHIDEVPVDLATVEERRIDGSRVSAVALTATDLPATKPPTKRISIPIAGTVALLALATGILLRGLFSGDASQTLKPVQRLDIPLTNMSMYGTGNRLAISPDGRSLIIQAGDNTSTSAFNNQLYLRSLDHRDLVPLPETNNAGYFTFSPDGNQVAFIASDTWTLKRLSLTSRRSITICEVGSNIRGLDWGPDDTIIYATSRGRPELLRVSATGGTPDTLFNQAMCDSMEVGVSYRFPQFLPDGDSVLLTQWPIGVGNIGATSARIVVFSLTTGRMKTLTSSGAGFAHYLPAIQSLVFVRNSTLVVSPFNIRTLSLTGEEITTSEMVVNTESGAKFSVSRDGILAMLEGAGGLNTMEDIHWVNMQGRNVRLDVEERDYMWTLDLSPDGQRFAVASQRQPNNEDDDIWVFGVDGSNPVRLTFESDNIRPVWSPDGRRVAFRSLRDGNGDIYIKDASGAGQAIKVVGTDLDEYPVSWTSNGDLLTYCVNTDAGIDIWILYPNGTTESVLDSPYTELTPVFSPDGEWIAYASNESGSFEIYVIPRPGSEVSGTWQISAGGGTEPVWAPDNRTIYYRHGPQMMAVEIETIPIFGPRGNPRMLFSGPFRTNEYYHTFDIHPDGDRFLMQMPTTASSFVSVLVINNWFEELRRLQSNR